MSLRNLPREWYLGLQISIADTGIGIAAKEQEKFSGDFTVVAKPEPRVSGVGLGLAICNTIMQLHGGSLEVSSEKNKGTVATAWFPLAPDHENQMLKNQLSMTMNTRLNRIRKLDSGVISMSTECPAGDL